MDTIQGLPAHLFFLHIPIVMVPLLSVVTIVMLVKPELRKKVGPYFAAVTGFVTVATFLTIESGEAFDDLTENTFDIAEHERLAKVTMVLVFVMFVNSIALALFDNKFKKEKIAKLLTVTLVIFSVTASIWMARTGHEGVRNLWEDNF